MTIEEFAQFIGTQALLIFIFSMAAMAVITLTLWHLLERYGEQLWRTLTRASNKLQQFISPTNLLTQRLTGSTIGKYLGVYAVFGFAIVFIALSGFFELTEALDFGEELNRFDHALAATLRASISPSTYLFFSRVTHLGDKFFLTALGAIVALILYRRAQWIHMAGWILALAGNALLNHLLKTLFQRVRPLHDHSYVMTEGWSFPSGHSSGALVTYGMFTYLLLRSSDRRWHLPIVGSALAIILIVGSSRIFLQVHFFSDVLAGFCSGTAWLTVCIAGTEIALRHRRA